MHKAQVSDCSKHRFPQFFLLLALHDAIESLRGATNQNKGGLFETTRLCNHAKPFL